MEENVLDYEIFNIYDSCLEQAKLGSMRGGNGEGALLFVSFAKNGMVLFKNRSRHKRDFLDDYGLSCSGFQEHAEQAVINDALKFARDKDDGILSADLYIAGYFDGKPYKYKTNAYICMNCASYIKEVFPTYSTHIHLPNLEGGWYSFTPFELFREAVEAYTFYGKTSEVRLASLEVIDDGK